MLIDWLPLEMAAERLSDGLYAHLADDGSLTRRIRLCCPDSFEVSLIDHKTVSPNEQECALLGLQPGDRALARQVFLCCDRQPRIYARTIIGLVEKNRPLTGRIENLGGQSLGSILFRDPLARKREMQLAELSTDHAFFQGVELRGLISARKAWVRRSLYDYQGCDLIVYEAFINFPRTPSARLAGSVE